MIRKSGIYYYCNLASPSIFDGEAIKNIDYDLDVKVYPDGSWEILDRDEYIEHDKKMNYGTEVKEIIEKELETLINMVKERKGPFKKEIIEKYYDYYQKKK